jgi:antitoxin YefM
VKSPLIIIQNGKSAMILFEVSEYQSMIDKLEIIEDVKLAEVQLSRGKRISHKEMKKKFLKRFSLVRNYRLS